MEKKELLELIESYKKQPVGVWYINLFTNALFNGKVRWLIKIADESVDNFDDYKSLYPIGTVIPCRENIRPDDDGIWDILGITEAGKLVEFKGEAIETE